MLFIFQGTTVGSIAGFMFALWVGIGSYSIKRHLDVLPTSTANCSTADDVTTDDVTTDLTTLITTMMTTSPATAIPEAITEKYFFFFKICSSSKLGKNELLIVLGERDLNVIYVSASASFSIDYNGKIIRIKRKGNNKSLSPSTIVDL